MNYFSEFLSFKICDAHLHAADLLKVNLSLPEFSSYTAISCAHTKEEFALQEKAIQNTTSKIYSAFGIHPFNPDLKNLEFLESLVSSKKITAIGEAGFDFFTPELKATQDPQSAAFEAQLSLCQKYKLPLILHGRKCNDRFFFYARELAKIPAVIFHSYMGTAAEAKSLLAKEINAFFSFGKPLINGSKKVIECIKSLPKEKILLETDAPFQVLKGESVTQASDILKVYEKAAAICGIKSDDEIALNEFCNSIHANLISVFES